MENGIASAACDDACSGTQADIVSVKDKLIDDATATELADLFKALGDGTRIRIIHALLQSELCVHDLTEVLGMGQSAISHQLRLLRNMRIVKRRKVGKTVFYSLDDDHVEQLIVLTMQHLKHG
ncbi:ArsR/SmtB family transcription factor [Paenibacillus sp. GCM10027627]|uniref:ArsR/SmtB family transcription factor n=1 Tax=unclassified Paenibacillus TaxID=185978 RepID=UPI00363D59F0